MWSLLDGEFDQVVMMDLDMVPLKWMDEIFKQKVPAAVARGASNSPYGGDVRSSRSFYLGGDDSSSKNLIGGINGGLVMDRPSKATFASMWHQLETVYVPRDPHGGEQDFLSWLFSWDCNKDHPKWNIISLTYNIQMHQLFWNVPLAAPDADWSTVDKTKKVLVDTPY